MSHAKLGPRSVVAFVRAGGLVPTLPGGNSFRENPDIYRIQSDGRESPIAPTDSFEGRIAWSPAGDRMALTVAIQKRGRPLKYRLFLMEPDGSNRIALGACPEACSIHGYPTWAPDGSTVAFANKREISQVNVTDGRVQTLAPLRDLRFLGSLSWSPDGASILFDAVSGDRPDIYSLAVSDGTITRLTQCKPPSCRYGNSEPAWAPDGELIAFVRNGIHIFVMSSEGAGARAIASCAAPLCREGYGNPEWSPSGESLVFELDEDGLGDLAVIDLNDNTVRKLTSGPGFDCCPSWAPVAARSV